MWILSHSLFLQQILTHNLVKVILQHVFSAITEQTEDQLQMALNRQQTEKEKRVFFVSLTFKKILGMHGRGGSTGGLGFGDLKYHLLIILYVVKHTMFKLRRCFTKSGIVNGTINDELEELVRCS